MRREETIKKVHGRMATRVPPLSNDYEKGLYVGQMSALFWVLNGWAHPVEGYIY